MADIFDQVASQSGQSPTMVPSSDTSLFHQAPPETAAPAGPNNPAGDIFDQVAASAPAKQVAPAAQVQAPGKDIFDQVAQPAIPNPDAPWYSKVWESANKPTIDLVRSNAGPIERGIENVASGLTSPLSLGMLLVTGGLGSLAEGAGASALESLAPDIAGTVSKAAGTISKLTHAGFTIQQIGSLAQAVPQLSDAIRAGDYDKAQELGTEALLGATMAGLSAKSLVSRTLGKETPFTGGKETIGAYQHEVENHNFEAREFEKANKQILNNPIMDMAARAYHEAGGSVEKLDKQLNDIVGSDNIPENVKKKWFDIFQQAKNLPQSVKDVSDALRPEYAKDWQELQSLGKANPESEGAQNYSGKHTYNQDDPNNSLKYIGPKPITKTAGFLQNREFDTISQALQAGFEPKDIGLVRARADYLRDFGVLKGAIAAEDSLRKQTAADGRPLGIEPNRVRTIDGKRVVPAWQPLSDAPADSAQAAIESEGLKYKGEVVPGSGVHMFEHPEFPGITAATKPGVELSPEYLNTKMAVKLKEFGHDMPDTMLNVSDYRQGPDTFARHRVIGTTMDEEGNENPVFQKVNLLIHPDAQAEMKNAFDQHSWFRENPIMSGVLAVSTQAKKSLVSLSPFHYATEALRGLQMGLNPSEAVMPKPVTDTSLALTQGVKHGLTLYGDQAGKTIADEGVSGRNAFIQKIPVAGKAMASIENNLFGEYIPRLKASVFEKIASQLKDKNPAWNEDQVYSKASAITNGAFGGVNWRQLGVSLGSQDALRTMFLAPDFTGSQLLFAKEGLQNGGSVVWQSMARIAAYNFAVARVLNMLTTGQAHNEHPFGVVSPDGKKQFSIRTMPEDTWRALTDSRQFVYDRTNPLLVRTAIEGLTGKDYKGKNVTSSQQVSDFFKNITPISAQGLIYRRPDESVLSQLGRGVGVQSQPNLSTAEKTLRQLRSSRSETGIVDPATMERHQTVVDLETKLRNGDAAIGDITAATRAGQITPVDRAFILKNAFKPELASGVANLPLTDALTIWDLAAADERQDPAFRQAIYKKLTTYNSKKLSAYTSAQRAYLSDRIQKAKDELRSSKPPNSLTPAGATMTFHQENEPGEDMNDPDVRYGAAQHEAGHAVISEALNPGTVAGISLDDSGGHTTVHAPNGTQTIEGLSHDDLRDMIATSFAGGMTEPGGTTALHSSNDVKNRSKLMGTPAATTGQNIQRLLTGKVSGVDPMLQANQTMAEAMARVNALLADPSIQANIKKLATHITAKGKLSGDEVRDILNSPNASISDMPKAIGKAEGYGVKGNIPTRQHNPGDLKRGGQIATFKNEQAGYKALEAQVRAIYNGSSHYYSPEMTLEDVAEKYTGKDKAKAWAKTVADTLNVKPTTKIKELQP